MKKLKERLKEPSTYGGIAAVLTGLGMILKDDHLPAIAQSIGQAADPLASGNYTIGLSVLLAGVVAMVKSENGRKD